MKRIGLMVLIGILGCSFGTTAYAAEQEETHDVVAKYEDNSTTSTVYSVDVAWGEMQFTYNIDGEKQWNPQTHEYVDNSKATWLAKGNTITVTNHSNVDVNAAFKFQALSAYNALTASFDKATVALPSADGKTVNDATLVARSNLSVGGVLDKSVSDFTKIGTVTITIN